MEKTLIRQIRFLQLYSGILTLALLILAILYVRKPDNISHFKQLDAERINIVDTDGRLRMVISNQKFQHPGIIDGKELSPRDRPAGMIFFNDDGDECGGLIFDGNKKEASATLSIDQYKNDQIMQLSYGQNNSPRTRTYGLKLWDRPDDFTAGALVRTVDSLQALHDTASYHAGIKKLIADGHDGYERLFLGKTTGKETGLFLRDSRGRVRIRIGIDSLDQVFFQTLDEKGNPVKASPQF